MAFDTEIINSINCRFQNHLIEIFKNSNTSLITDNQYFIMH